MNSNWRNKLKQHFEQTNGVNIEEVQAVQPGTAIERSLTERLTKLKLTDKYEPTDTLVMDVQMGTSPGSEIKSEGGELHKIAQKILLASLPGKAVVPVCYEFPEFNKGKLYLPGEWGIIPTDVKFAKAIGYTMVESFVKSLGISHANRPYTRAQIEAGRSMILVETDKSFQIWAQPVGEQLVQMDPERELKVPNVLAQIESA